MPRLKTDTTDDAPAGGTLADNCTLRDANGDAHTFEVGTPVAELPEWAAPVITANPLLVTGG